MAGIIFNEDCTHFIHARNLAGIKVTEKVLRDFIAQYQNTQITDFVINPNGMISFSPSQTRQTALDKYAQLKKAGKADESNNYCEVLYDIYVNQGLDMYAIWFEQCRQCGMKPWLSVRMNDCHVNNEADHLLLSDFFLKHQSLRRVMHHPYDNYFNYCLDYGQEPARRHYLEYILECLETYDFDGLELDWMREIFCFKPGGESAGVAIINDFMRTVKQAVDAAAHKRGHAIALSVRLPHSPITALKLGFDVMTWMKEGLIDLVIPTPRWETTDTDMSLDFWKRLTEPYGVALAGGVELGIRPTPTALPLTQTIETLAGNAAVIFAGGADKVYFFNLMDAPIDNAQSRPDVPDFDYAPCSPKNYPTLLHQFGSLEAVSKLPRRHVVTFHDIEAVGIKKCAMLPVRAGEDKVHQPVRIENGRITAAQTVTLIIAARADRELTEKDFSVFVNSAPVNYLGKVTVPFAYSTAPHYGFRVPNTGKLPAAAVAEFAATGIPYTVEHVELRVE